MEPNQDPILEEKMDKLNSSLISFRLKILESQASFANSIGNFFDKIAIVSIGAITLSITFLPSLIEKNPTLVKNNSSLIFLSWLFLLGAAAGSAIVRVHYAEQENLVRNDLLNLESRIWRINPSFLFGGFGFVDEICS